MGVYKIFHDVPGRECRICKEYKTAENFRRLPQGALLPYCNPCKIQKARGHYEQRKNNESYKEKHREMARKQRQKYPEKIAARVKAEYYRASLIKDSCEDCGGSENLHMHHEDYSKPLEVNTLCALCHRALHIREGVK